MQRAEVFKFAAKRYRTYKRRPLRWLVHIWYQAVASSVLLAYWKVLQVDWRLGDWRAGGVESMSNQKRPELDSNK